MSVMCVHFFPLSHLCPHLQHSRNNLIPCGCLYTGSDYGAKAGNCRTQLLLSGITAGKKYTDCMFGSHKYFPSGRICTVSFIQRDYSSHVFFLQHHGKTIVRTAHRMMPRANVWRRNAKLLAHTIT